MFHVPVGRGGLKARLLQQVARGPWGVPLHGRERNGRASFDAGLHGVLQEYTAVAMASMGGVDTNVGGGGGGVFLGFQQRGGGGGPFMVPFTILTGSMGSLSVHVNGVLPSFGVGPTHVVK